MYWSNMIGVYELVLIGEEFMYWSNKIGVYVLV